MDKRARTLNIADVAVTVFGFCLTFSIIALFSFIGIIAVVETGAIGLLVCLPAVALIGVALYTARDWYDRL